MVFVGERGKTEALMQIRKMYLLYYKNFFFLIFFLEFAVIISDELDGFIFNWVN